VLCGGSQGVQDDIATMQPTVDGIVSVSAVLRSHAEPAFSGHLQADVGSLRTRWAAVADTARRHSERLAAAVDETRAAWDRLGGVEAWCDDVSRASLSREYTVHSDDELHQFTDNFHVRIYIGTRETCSFMPRRWGGASSDTAIRPSVCPMAQLPRL